MGSSWSTAAPTAIDAHEQPRCRCAVCIKCCEGSSSSGSSNGGGGGRTAAAGTEHQNDGAAALMPPPPPPLDRHRNESVVTVYSPAHRRGASTTEGANGASTTATTNPLRALSAATAAEGAANSSSSSEGRRSSATFQQQSGSNLLVDSRSVHSAATSDSLDATGSFFGARRATVASASLGSSLSDERRRSSVTRTPSTRSVSHTQTPREAVSLQGVDISSRGFSAMHQPLVQLIRGSSGETVSLCSPQLPVPPNAVLWLEGEGDAAASPAVVARPARPRRLDLLLVDVPQAESHGESIATSRRRSSHISPLVPTPRLGSALGSATHFSEPPECIDEAAKGGRSHWTVRRLQTSFSSLGSVASHALDGSCASIDLSGRHPPAAARDEVRSARAQPMSELVLERGFTAVGGTPSSKCYDSLGTAGNLDELDAVPSPDVGRMQQPQSNRAPDVNQPLDLPWPEERLIEDDNYLTIHRPRVAVTSPALRHKSIAEADVVLPATCDDLL